MDLPRRRSTRLLTSSGGPDLISALHDDQLLLVLACLHCVAAAARTVVLSRRWRGLWTRLRHIFLSDVPFRSIETALGRFPLPPPAVSLIDIRIPSSWTELRRLVHWTDTASTTSLLHAAAQLDPGEFVFELPRKSINPSLVVELPCFHRATSIVLALRCDIVPRFPAGHEFTALETLSLSYCRADIERLLSCCPRLRTLRLIDVDFHNCHAEEGCTADCPCQPMDWKSPLEEVDINGFRGDGHGIDFLKMIFKCAPVLRKMTVKLSSSSNNDGRTNIYNTFEAYSSVELYVA